MPTRNLITALSRGKLEWLCDPLRAVMVLKSTRTGQLWDYKYKPENRLWHLNLRRTNVYWK